MIVVCLCIGFVILGLGLVFLIQGAPYVASEDNPTNDIIKLTQGLKPRRVVDLGAGKGKLVIALTKAGFKVDGVELNPILVFRARRAIKLAGLEGKASVIWANMWSFKTDKYDLVVIYAIKHIMPKLESKLTKELKPGAHMISNYFTFPNLKPLKTIGKAKLYKVPT